MLDSTNQTTRILLSLGKGESGAAQKLLPLVYDELRTLATSYFRSESNDHTLQPTALVHEAFVRLVDATEVQWKDKAHFFALAATAMRRILTDHARARRSAKRGGNWRRITLDRAVTPPTEAILDTVALDDALTSLASLDDRKHRVVELRFFGGLTVEEVAAVLGVSKTTAESEWRASRAWLQAELGKASQE